jgi:hypothetical protein
MRRNFEISSNLSVIVEKVLKMAVFGTSRLKNFNEHLKSKIFFLNSVFSESNIFGENAKTFQYLV